MTMIVGGFVSSGASFANTIFASWRIFNIAIEALTIVINLVVTIFLPDSPVKAKRFTESERVAALMRVKREPEWHAEFAYLRRSGFGDFQVRQI